MRLYKCDICDAPVAPASRKTLKEPQDPLFTVDANQYYEDLCPACWTRIHQAIAYVIGKIREEHDLGDPPDEWAG